MSARVLVVDDIEQNRKLLTDKLKNEYFHVVTAVDGEDAIERALAEEPDVILMDIMMPRLNGIDACRRLKTDPRTEHIPIVLVTALNEREDRLRGLGAGADDFLTKPVSLAVLAARVRALLRRTAASSTNLVTRGALAYDLTSRTCAVGGEEVTLTAREDQLLRVLLLANGACVDRQELLDAVWGPESGVDPTNLDIQLRRLRAKLAPTAVENVRGIGYRIVA